ncbi:MAG: hypothetical protein M3Y87_07265 [Myxococcota bacterium]|nr:hypothetical protein [Myxococcota bacterium]
METADAAAAPIPLSLADVVATSTRILRAQLAPIATACAIGIFPIAFLDILLGIAGVESTAPSNIASAIANAWLCATITHLALAGLLDRPMSFADAASLGKASIGSVFGVSLLSGLLIVLGTVLFVVPGVIAWIATYVAIPACVIERRSAGDSLARSNALTRGNWLSLAAVIIPITIVLALPLVVIFAPIAAVIVLESEPLLIAFESPTSPLVLALSGATALWQCVWMAFGTVAATVIFARLTNTQPSIDAPAIADVFA